MSAPEKYSVRPAPPMSAPDVQSPTPPPGPEQQYAATFEQMASAYVRSLAERPDGLTDDETRAAVARNAVAQQLGPSPEPATWPAEYVGAGDHLAVERLSDGRYFARNPQSVHYPHISFGTWSEWVLLARRILACERERLRQEGGAS